MSRFDEFNEDLGRTEGEYEELYENYDEDFDDEFDEEFDDYDRNEKSRTGLR